MQIRNISKGESIGYDALYKADRDMVIATLGVGYADGVPISYSGVGCESAENYVRYFNEAIPIVGRVSMDLTILDITQVAERVKVGVTVELYGAHLESVAKNSETISYELLVRLGQRCSRIYEV